MLSFCLVRCTLKVPVEIQINQISDGYEYDGECKIANKPFAFRINFPMGIERFCTLTAEEMPSDPDDIQKFLPITVTTDGNPITLRNEAYGLFMTLVAPFVIEFFNNPQTRNNNEGLVGDILHGTSPLSKIASIKIGMSTKRTLNISDDGQRDILRSIGCEL